MFVLDTNTLIYFFKGQGRVAEHLLATPPLQVAVPAVVVFELETGIAKSGNVSRRREQFARLLDTVTVLPFDQAAAVQAAGVRAELEHRGGPIGPMDTLIAGTVLAQGGCLVTHNTADFRRVEGLEVVDWYHGDSP